MATEDSDERAPWPDLAGHDSTYDSLDSERAPSPDIFNGDIAQKDSNEGHQVSPSTESVLPVPIEKVALASNPSTIPSNQLIEEVASEESLRPKLLEDGYTSAAKSGRDKRICGIKRKVFFAVSILLTVIVVCATIGGAVGGTRRSSKTKLPTEQSYSPALFTSTSVPASTTQAKLLTSSTQSESSVLSMSWPTFAKQTEYSTLPTPSESPFSSLSSTSTTRTTSLTLFGISAGALGSYSSAMSTASTPKIDSSSSTTMTTETSSSNGPTEPPLSLSSTASSTSSAASSATPSAISWTTISTELSSSSSSSSVMMSSLSLSDANQVSAGHLTPTGSTESSSSLSICPTAGHITGCCVTWPVPTSSTTICNDPSSPRSSRDLQARSCTLLFCLP
ncbi:hypothetical protein V1517DRAFT_11365 [Lipomyces orientalis]|uniref:Uncharacterized protein n=1 Tax=Lipomyces orientalis TaxID=1233043 RepID=A0ACC3TG76_9ASCO